MVIWRFCDGKPGHEQQSLGLVAALTRRQSVTSHDLSAPNSVTALAMLITHRYPPGSDLPPPDVLVGAGHATHLPMLAAKRRWGGRTVVLMKPSLPTRWFDLCVVPEHDGVPTNDKVITTVGVLNAVPMTEVHAAHQSNSQTNNETGKRGLILVGGPSSHHSWNADATIDAITQIVNASTETHWAVADSRRTPASMRARLATLDSPNCTFHAATTHPAPWLTERLTEAGTIWVTGDSISMLFEALSTSAAVGVLPVPIKKPTRVTQVVQQLIDAQRVGTLQAWANGQPLISGKPLREADRIASEISKRGWNKRG